MGKWRTDSYGRTTAARLITAINSDAEHLGCSPTPTVNSWQLDFRYPDSTIARLTVHPRCGIYPGAGYLPAGTAATVAAISRLPLSH